MPRWKAYQTQTLRAVLSVNECFRSFINLSTALHPCSSYLKVSLLCAEEIFPHSDLRNTALPDPEGGGDRGERGAMVKTFFNGSSLNAVAAAVADDDGLGDHGGREERVRGPRAGHAHFARNPRYLSSLSHPAVDASSAGDSEFSKCEPAPQHGSPLFFARLRVTLSNSVYSMSVEFSSSVHVLSIGLLPPFPPPAATHPACLPFIPP